MLKVNIIIIKEDNIIIQYKIYSDNNDNKTNIDNITNNLITLNIRKLTSKSFFILVKYVWDVPLKEDIILSIKNFIGSRSLSSDFEYEAFTLYGWSFQNHSSIFQVTYCGP